HMQVLRGQRFSDQQGIGSAVPDVAEGDLGARAGEHAADIAGVAGGAIVGARRPSPLGHVAELLIGLEIAAVIQALWPHAAYVVADRLLGLPAVAGTAYVGKQSWQDARLLGGS